MTPSEQCKSAGLKSLAELSRISEVSEQTLINWHHNKPKLFALVIAGAGTINIVIKKQRLCESCKHLDDSEEGWKFCDRPNYPEGYRWNLLCAIQRYHDETNNELCNGKYWEPKQ